MAWEWGWRPYVPVAQRRANATRQVAKLVKKGTAIEPVTLQGRQIARTFWGKAWCNHLESFSDFSNRLPRGRSYVRNGSVCHLAIAKGRIEALVSGSSLYRVTIKIRALSGPTWGDVKRRCAGQIASLLDLLQGRLSDGVMSVVTDRSRGLFPQPGEIAMACSCPDWAVMCKHVAAVLYGTGARLDTTPELLFTLRGVDHAELVQVETAALTAGRGKTRRLRAGALEEIFGIDIASGDAAASPAPTIRTPRGRRREPKRVTGKRQATQSKGKGTPRAGDARAEARTPRQQPAGKEPKPRRGSRSSKSTIA